ncbi:MAG TPA: ABC transporter permease subunit [Actinocrinis sp.]|jgi:ABC-2 type transport system permease protein|uniref:ABC transporter permease n=1 Tax=Actinocrinis sp. TaxID=1920516 RepID=UPI002DDD22ED|nr:ABC transporter permease subunit [Actinocrinis sp.]HEV3170810.1 ABC transporter permease subunit [Actinocrinis sp.]
MSQSSVTAQDAGAQETGTVTGAAAVAEGGAGAQAVPADTLAASGRPSPVSLTALRGGLAYNELVTMFRRWRNIALLASLALIPIALGIAIKLTTAHRGGGGFIEQVSNNGLFLVFTALTLTLPIFLPLAIGVVAGDAVSGEANQGTLRYLLVAPVGRNRLLAVKGGALVVFCLVASFTVAVSAFVVGLILFPTGNVTLLSGDTISFGAALVKALLITVLVAASLLGLAAIGLFVSTLTDTPIAAMAVTVGLTVLSGILQSIPQLSAIQPWLFTDQWTSFADLLRDPVYTPNIIHNLLIQGLYVAVFGSAAWARLTSRDVLA